jgi:hypothetical protein
VDRLKVYRCDWKSLVALGKSTVVHFNTETMLVTNLLIHWIQTWMERISIGINYVSVVK